MNKDAQDRWKVGMSNIKLKMRDKSWQTNAEMPEKVFSDELSLVYGSYRRDREFLDCDRHLMRQHLFVMRDEYIGVDKIFRYEEYDEINAFILKVGVKQPVQKRMVTRRWSTDVYLTEENRARIYDMYADDFRYFNYSR